jgi:cation diffusion facilitator family transporter
MSGQVNEKMSRDREIIRASVIGILANVLLAGFKAVVGLMSHSIAIVMDAVNNISDAASSIITIVGTKLAGKAPDRKHPFGHGRVEYLSAMLISILVLYAGLTAFIESVKKIIHPETPDYAPVTLVIVAVAVAVKILLGRYVKSVGERMNSDSLVNSGEDATLDSVISASTLVAAGIYLLFGISLEAWLGAIIALIIIKSGIEMLRDTLSQILGERADAELARAIKDTIISDPQVSGAYDLVLHNYGPDAFQGSVHIEIPDTLSASEIDKLIRKISVEVYRKHHVILTAVGVYSVNTRDPKAIEAREKVREIVMSHENALQMHGFFLDEEDKAIRFDVVISFDEKDRGSLYRHICQDVQKVYPDYTIQAALDTDFSVS